MSFGFGFALPAYPLRGGGGNNPFNQDGATLDLSFIGTAGDLSGADTYTLNTDFITPEYQVAAQYAVWENGVGLAQKTFAQIVTFTRASTATYFNSAGTLTTAATNEARFDHNPSTLAPLGFLIEESRTNSIRNNTMVGAVAGTPGTLPTNWLIVGAGLGTLTQQIVGTGTSAGITYIDVKISGTTSTTSFGLQFDAFTQIAALSGQTWTGSFWVSRVAGANTNISSVNIRVHERDVGGVSLGNTTVDFLSTLSTTFTRNTATRTMANASTAFVTSDILVAFASGVAIDITLRIGLPQLELGSFATSVIPTTTTALTRSADVASVNTLSPWFNSVEGTLYADVAGRVSGTQPYITMLSNTGETERIYQRYVSGQYQSIARVAGVDIANVYNSSEGSSVNAKVATAYNASQLATSTNGAAVTGFAVASLASVPSGLNRLWIGSFAGTGAFANGYLRRIAYYPRRLTNADLQAITT